MLYIYDHYYDNINTKTKYSLLIFKIGDELEKIICKVT